MILVDPPFGSIIFTVATSAFAAWRWRDACAPVCHRGTRAWRRGIGYVDAHLLAAARLTAKGKLRTRDRPSHAVATELGPAAVLSH